VHKSECSLARNLGCTFATSRRYTSTWSFATQALNSFRIFPDYIPFATQARLSFREMEEDLSTIPRCIVRRCSSLNSSRRGEETERGQSDLFIDYRLDCRVYALSRSTVLFVVVDILTNIYIPKCYAEDTI
jgi:hypothetical protein